VIAHADVQKPPALTMVVPKPKRPLKTGYHWVFETVGTTNHGYRWVVVYRWVMVKGPAPTGAGTINQNDSGGFAG
jgi:hypothetical protein